MVGPKVIYLAERGSGLSGDAWLARWREHGEINRSRNYWRHLVRYEQDATLPMPPEIAAVAPGAVTDDSKGGTGQVWYRSHQAYVDMGQEPTSDHDLIRHDELETFGRTVEHYAVVAEEQARRETGDIGVKLVIFARDPQGRGRKAFWRAWRACAASDEVAGLLADATGYIENVALALGHPLADADQPDRSRFPDYDGVIEIGFRDVAHATAAAADPAHARAWERIAGVVSDDTQTVLVRRTELYNELEGVDWIIDALMNARRATRDAPTFVQGAL